ncbi:hypothetical protein [Vulcanisaeta distributa]|uniref:hypothetical protein n=1 Tax=Vulcanisaeta distributa TaxID=164451 RepID=UPI001FB2BCC7|nr:hypothetical protein [Vulcanisaeta distributa]
MFESTPNSTVTSASQYIYTVTYTGFGPIYYVTNEFSGLNPADHNYPMVTAEPVTLTVNELFPSGQTLMLFNYTTATSNYQTTPRVIQCSSGIHMAITGGFKLYSKFNSVIRHDTGRSGLANWCSSH